MFRFDASDTAVKRIRLKGVSIFPIKEFLVLIDSRLALLLNGSATETRNLIGSNFKRISSDCA